MAGAVIQLLSKSFPTLPNKLKQAEIKDLPEDFIKKIIFSAGYLSVGVAFFLGILLSKFGVSIKIPIIGLPIIFAMFFSYMMRMPDLKIIKKQKEIDREIVFAGRFMIVEIESGVSLYNALKNTSKSYQTIGRYFREVIDKVDLGTSVTDALNEMIETNPSNNLRRILWQIVNSIETGSDTAKSLGSVIDQITQEQNILIKEYGRKLNPLAMFYMILAVIIPSLGITMLIILSTFMSFQLDLPLLLFVSFVLAFIQFMFVAMIKASRPAVEL